ncbi:hypothetical protein [Streptomyces sp. Caat 7-52]|uniref:hypothetical protein n=1 Tax=Streptomyces sp. Caat 7-52 TaxID=2949637 RepID=UPI002034B1B6|nr:hypothetical protein [Streptomyces sp. Caat 7-52]
MTLSSTLAFGTAAGSLLVAALVGAVTVAVAILGYRHTRRLYFEMKTRQTVEDNAKDLDSVTSRLEEIVDKLCEYAQKPCKSEDFAPLRKYRNLISNFAEQLEMIRPELNKVVKHFDAYLAKPVLAPTIATLTPLQLEEAQERAMEQEYARVQLHTAVSAAQQKIRALRRVQSGTGN